MNFDSIYKSLNKNLSGVPDKKSRSDSLSNISVESWSPSITANDSHHQSTILSKSNTGGTLQAPKINFDLENKIRELFGKPIKSSDDREIGCHPDFKNIEEDESKIIEGYSVTLFMDIIGSTKLGVMYHPYDVFFIKNSVIKCAIETINAFDGHVHRIMGDAVMAFFRSKDAKNHMDSAIDAINCATYLIQMIKMHVQPSFKEVLGDENIGIRIGIDYGKDKDVVWGYYGHGTIREVTATSFFVDAAAKLQQKAPKNSLMIGQSVKELMGLDSEHYEIKTSSNNEKDYYLTPNYTGSDGNQINYKQFIFDTTSHFSKLPGGMSNKNIKINVKIRDHEKALNGITYKRCAFSIPKNKHLYIHIEYLSKELSNRENIKFKCEVFNTGDEARETNPETLNNHTTDLEIIKFNPIKECYFANHYESTCYKGLHKLVVSVIINNQVIEKDEFSVFINQW